MCLVGTCGRALLKARGNRTNSSSLTARAICAPKRCSAAAWRCWQSVESRALRLAASLHVQYYCTCKRAAKKINPGRHGGRTTSPTRPPRRARAQDVTCLTGDADETARSRPNRRSIPPSRGLVSRPDVPTRDICRWRRAEPTRSSVRAIVIVFFVRRSM